MDKKQQKNIIYGPNLGSEIPNISVGQFLYDNLQNVQDRNSISMIDIDTEESITYGDILRKSILLAESLRNCGCGKNSIVTICSENSIHFFPAMAAIFYTGATLALVNHTYALGELEHALKISKPQIVLCSKYVASKMVTIKRKNTYLKRVIVIDAPSIESFIKGNTTFDDYAIENFQVERIDNVWDQTCLIICSSGTTGLPKGVMITHANIHANLIQLMTPDRQRDEQEVSLGLLPFYHAFGTTICISSVVLKRRLIIMKKFDLRKFLKAIQDCRISRMHLVPPIVNLLAKTPLLDEYDLSCVEVIACGAAPLSKDIEELIQKRLKNASLLQGYGQTESTLSITRAVLDSKKLGSVGTVSPGMMVKVVDTETGKALGPNQTGEMCCKGPLVMKGYYNNEEATKQTIKDGWLYTGDLGYYDENEHFYIVGRQKELIKCKGFQVPPSELEAVLLNHPDIIDAGVTSKPDDVAGEVPVAFVVKKPGSNITEKEVDDFVASKVSPPKRLNGNVYFVSAIPKIPSGKILRRELKKYLKKFSSKL